MTMATTNTNTVYGYARISRKQQSIERQIRNIKNAYPEATIVEEAFTGTKIAGRRKFEDLIKTVKAGDTIVFDSVSRMSRNADEGIKQYMQWFDMGVNLVFLKEGYINTSVYASKLQQADISTGKAYLDEGLKVILMGLAEEQIRIAFEQAQKEVDDLHQRTKEGIATARLMGKQIGRRGGFTYQTGIGEVIKKRIQKHAKEFGGTLKDKEIMNMYPKVARNTYYKYKKQLLEEA